MPRKRVPRLRRAPPPDPPCTVAVSAIRFNHDAAAHTADALHVRRNASTTVTIPEWAAGRTTKPEDSPAAYALQETRGNRLTLRVRFTIAPNTLRTATVRAAGGGVLGEIDPLTVNFTNGVSDDGAGGQFVEVPLSHQQLHQRNQVLREDVEWQWQYRCPNTTDWVDTTKTAHRIYAVLREPPAPWSQADAAKYPWTDALDHACDGAEAGGASDAAAAATKVVQHVFRDHGASYNTIDGGSSYADAAGAFDLTTYLQNLPNLGIVGCYDGAAAVCALSAAVGCATTFQLHAPFGYLPQLDVVGGARTNNPLFNSAARLAPQFGVARPFREYGRVAPADEVGRSPFGNHAYALLAGKVFDATMRPPGGWFADVAPNAYLAAAIDESLAAPVRIPVGNVPFQGQQVPGTAVFSERTHQLEVTVNGNVFRTPPQAVSGVAAAPVARTVTVR